MGHRTQRTLVHTAIYLGGQVAARGLAVLLIPLYTRVLHPAEFALWDLCMTTVLFLNPVFNLGMQSAILRFYFHFETFDDQRRAYNSAMALLIFTIGPSILLIGIFAPDLAGLLFREPERGLLILLTAVLSAATALSQQPLALLRAQERSLTYSLLQVVRGLTAPAIILLLVLVYDLGVAGILLGESAGLVLLMAAGVVATWRWFRPAFDLSKLKPMLVFGIPLIPMSIGGALLAVSDRYILRAYFSLEEMAPYSLGFKVGMSLSLLIQALQLSWQPAALQLDKQDGGRASIAKNLLIFQLLLLGIAMGLTCFAPEAARIFAPETGYEGAEWFIPWIALSYAIHGVVYLLTAGLGIAKRTVWASIIFCTAGGVKIALALTFIPEYGLAAAAITTLAAFSFELIFMWIVVQRIYPLPLDIKRLSASIVLSGVVLAGVLASYSLPALTSFAVRIALFLGFAGACYIGILTAADRQSIKNLLARRFAGFQRR